MKIMLKELLFIARRVNETAFGWRVQHAVLLRHPTAKIDRTVRIVTPRRLELGEHVQLQANVLLHCGGLAWSGKRGGIRIGARSVISPQCVFYGAGTIDIGDNFDCGPGVMIFSSRSVYEADRKAKNEEHHLAPVSIGRNVVMFGGAIVSPGVTIGDGAVIGAGAVVLKDVAAGAFVAGVPARSIRALP
jgi:acetyltransferase-like isoleucine patch superfamily enzyme